jgi:RNA 3'-terminal phosphate cyclase (ATP)
MLEIDGSQKSGSGTILRISMAFAAIKGDPLHIFNIRQNRPKPGLQPQHLEAVLTAGKLCNAELKGATLGSSEIWFIPHEIVGGEVTAEIGTAGNIPMLFMAVLPICLFAKQPTKLLVTKGGTDTQHAPTVNYLRNVFLPTLKRMGVEAELSVQRYGYYPRGNGEATLTLKPQPNLKPFRIEEFGRLTAVRGVSICTFLSDRRVAQRQATAATQSLNTKGYQPDFQVINDKSNPVQRGSSIALWAETDSGVLLGGDAIGELKKTAETVGAEAAENLLAELEAQATVDTHLADMLIPYVALAEGESVYLTRKHSDHLDSNIWLAKRLLGTSFNVESVGALFRVEKRV